MKWKLKSFGSRLISPTAGFEPETGLTLEEVHHLVRGLPEVPHLARPP